jgi:hypothetical protein
MKKTKQSPLRGAPTMPNTKKYPMPMKKKGC